MGRKTTARALRDMLREQLCCIGRVAARHRLPDDAVWELAKGFEVIYQRAIGPARNGVDVPITRHATPHAGLAYFLDKLDSEDGA